MNRDVIMLYLLWVEHMWPCNATPTSDAVFMEGIQACTCTYLILSPTQCFLLTMAAQPPPYYPPAQGEYPPPQQPSPPEQVMLLHSHEILRSSQLLMLRERNWKLKISWGQLPSAVDSIWQGFWYGWISCKVQTPPVCSSH